MNPLPLLPLLSAVAFGVIAQVAFAAPPTRPNVLVIISDDQGYGDFGFTGNGHVHTPHLDRLASQSAVLRNFVVAPACAPTRAAIFTGRNHLLTGVWGVPPRANLRADEARMPAFFRAEGYRTLHVGKLGGVRMDGKDGHHFGWEEWVGGGGYEQKDPMIYSSRGHRQAEGWTADIWTDYAIDFMRRHEDQPWFATLAFIIPHLPWEADERFRQPFVDRGFSKELADCYGAIAQMDENIGRVLRVLEETGQQERTIVVFVSDNGATGPEVRRMTTEGAVKGGDWARRNVAGLRGAKATVWENGVRVPLLVRWPGRIPAGDRVQFGRAEDLLPTLLDLARVDEALVAHQTLTGHSFAGALRDPAATAPIPGAFILAMAGAGSPRDGVALEDILFENHHLALREERFKYHAFPGGRSALYDLAADPGEATDVASLFPEQNERLARETRRRWDELIASGRALAPQSTSAAQPPPP
jgi:arylsulfatase A-like enzyme